MSQLIWPLCLKLTTRDLWVSKPVITVVSLGIIVVPVNLPYLSFYNSFIFLVLVPKFSFIFLTWLVGYWGKRGLGHAI